MNMMPAADNKHYMTYADSMTYTGYITAIDKSGIEKREKNNILLSLAFSHPIQGLENAAINSLESTCSAGLSAPLMVGSIYIYLLFYFFYFLFLIIYFYLSSFFTNDSNSSLR